MYHITLLDYSKKSSHIVYKDSLYNCLEKMYEYALLYILNNQGSSYGEDIYSFIYEHGEKPDISRLFMTGTFYIEKNNRDLCCISVKENKKIYGVLMNSSKVIKHIKLSVVKLDDNKIDYFTNLEFDYKFEYDGVMKELALENSKKVVI